MTQADFNEHKNPVNSLLPKSLHRQAENPPITPPIFLPESVRLSSVNPAMEASYLNLLSLNNHMLSPFIKKFMLGSRRQIPVSPPVIQSPLTKSYEIEETGELVKSVIEGETVMGFNVWGEVRLCLPHLLRFVLNDVDIDEIVQAINKLKIACTKCSLSQLSSLHNCNALPSAVTSCGLIRKSDAERMLKYLRVGVQRPTLAEVGLKNSLSGDRVDKTISTTIPSTNLEESPSKPEPKISGIFEDYISVRHDCFGSQKGKVYPHLYNTPTSPCVLCQTCDKLFSPPDFVGHTHAVTELDSCCHWGFDSTNWRSYLHLDLHTNPHIKAETRSRLFPTDQSDSDTYRILNEFKVKFLKPLNFSDTILAKLGQVDTNNEVSVFVRPTRRSPDVPLDYRKVKSTLPSPTSTYSASPQLGVLRATLTSPPSRENESTTPGTTSVPLSPLEFSLHCPSIKFRRLWAPHGGQLHIPLPPKLISECPKGPKPSNLSVDGPILLDPSCVVTKDSAHLYDRDFIPNVCLKPLQPADLSKSLSSIPSNDDISTTGKRSSMEDIFPMSNTSNRYRISRRTAPGEFMPRSVSKCCHNLDSTASSPARARHSSCAQELLVPAFSILSAKPIKENGDTVVLYARSPSADALAEPSKLPLPRTASNPELRSPAPITITPRLPKKRNHFGAPTTPLFSIGGKRCPGLRIQDCLQQSPYKTKVESPIDQKNETRPISVPPESEQKRTSCPSFQTPTESMMNWALAADSNARIPNLVSHWVNLLERVSTFCGTVELSSSRQPSSLSSFEAERSKLFVDLHSIREKHFADLSIVLEENRKLWKLLTDALMLSGASQSLTPNTCAPPFGRIPGITDQFPGFPISQTCRNRNTRDSLQLNVSQPSLESQLNVNERSKFPWRMDPGGNDISSGQDSILPNPIASLNLNGAISAYLARQNKGEQKRTPTLPDANSLKTSGSYFPNPVTIESSHGEFILPNKRQRLLL